MPAYQRRDARAWAREHLVGCAAVTIPSYSADLKRLNERGIRHDIALAQEFGYTYCWRRWNIDQLGMRLKTWTTWR